MKLNFDSPCSESWFIQVWKEQFPTLFTENDKPQCVQCFEFKENQKEAFRKKDGALATTIRLQKDQHLKQARDIFELHKNAHARAPVFAEEASIVVDNMASKVLPKFRKEKSDTWSKQKLVVHIGGTHFDHNSEVHYYIYPEIISESANTIISQLEDSLRKLKGWKPKLQNVTITFDNHSTQKNYVVIGYLEWQFRAGYLPIDGCFHVIFLVRGHTHTHLDAANKAPRTQYFKASSITKPSDMVCKAVYLTTVRSKYLIDVDPNIVPNCKLQ